MAGLVNYGSSGEEDNIQDDLPKMNVSLRLRTVLEQADSTDPRRRAFLHHRLIIRMVPSMVSTIGKLGLKPLTYHQILVLIKSPKATQKFHKTDPESHQIRSKLCLQMRL